MKKFISFFLVATLVFASMAPAMAASDSYLANQTKYYAVDFEKDAYTAGNTITALSDEGSNVTYNSKNMITTIVSDAVKGGKSMKIEKKAATPNEFYFGTAFGSNTIAAGDRLCFELSVKAESLLYLALKDESAGSIALGGLYYGLASWPAGTTLTTPKLITANEWHHMVYEIVPGTSNGTVTVYLDGTTIGSVTNTVLSIANLTTKLNSYKLYVNGNGNLIDDIKFWKSTTAYDATAAGDVAGITSDFAIVDNTIVYSGVSTLAELKAKLTATANGTIAFLTEDNAAVTDESVAIEDTYKVVARSASGAVFKIYTIEGEKLSSEVYGIANNTISGVDYYTAVADFKAALSPKTGAEVSYNLSSPYVKEGDTVTVDGVEYTVKLETLYDGFVGGVGEKFRQYSISNLNGVSAVTFEGKAARKISFNSNTGIEHLQFTNAKVFADTTVNDGDVLNLEFSYYGTENTSITVTMAGYPAIVMKGTSKFMINNSTVEGVTAKVGEWNKVVVSMKKNGLTTGGTTYTIWNVYLNGKKVEGPANTAGSFATTSGQNWTGLSNNETSCQWRVTQQGSNEDSAYLADVKLYKAARMEYAPELATSANDVYVDADKKLIFVDENNIEAAVSSLSALNGGTISTSGEGIDTVVEVTDATGIETDTYSLAKNNTLYVAGTIIYGYSPEASRIYVAVKDSAGNLVTATAGSSDGSKITSYDKANFGTLNNGQTVTAYFWTKDMKPLCTPQDF